MTIGRLPICFLLNGPFRYLPEEGSIFFFVGLQAGEIEVGVAFRISDGDVDSSRNAVPAPNIIAGRKYRIG